MSELLRKLCWSLVLVVVASCGGGKTDDSDLTAGTSKLMTSSNYGQPASAEAQAAAAAELKSYFAGDKTRVLKDASLTESASIDTKASASGFTPRAAYRFFNTATGVHFYTVSEEERQRVQSTLPQFQFEGTGFFAVTANQNDLSPVYRFYNRVSGTHFYTISVEERDHVAATWPNIFAYEGIAWYASKVKGPGWLPIYRFFNTQTGTHFYSATPVERDNVITNLPQFAYEGIGYYIRLNGSLDSALVGSDANNNGVRDNVEQVLSRLVLDPASLLANVRVAAAYEKALSQPLPTNRDQAIELMGEIACVEAISGSDRIFESETFGLLPILFDTDMRVARWREWVRALEGGYSSDELPHCTQGIETRSQLRKSTNPFDNLEGQSDHQDRPVKVVFVNGITNSIADAKYSANHLASALDFRGKDDFSYIHFYNPTENFIRDNNELNFQAEQSWSASVAAHINEDRSVINRGSSKKYLYYQTLGSIYADALPRSAEANRAVAQTRLLAHRIATHLRRFPRQTLILVPHSQGNYYVEAAMGVLLHSVRNGVIQDISEQQLLERVKVFGVATISATTWNFEGLDYVRLPNDRALNVHNSLAGVFADSVPWNIRSSCDEGTGELSNHGFVKTYLSLFCTVEGSSVSLRDYVGTRIRDLFPTAVVSLAPPVAQLNQPTTFSIIGIKLPSTAIMSIADAECLMPVNRTPTGFQQTCTPRGATGTKTVTVKTNTDANGGVVIDDSRTIEVTGEPYSFVVSWDYGSVGASVQGRGPNPVDVTVVEGPEIVGFLDNAMLDVDVAENNVRLFNFRSYVGSPGNAAFDGAAFNGFVLRRPAGATWEFRNVSVDSSSSIAGLSNDRLSIHPDYISINLAGLTYNAGSAVQINFERSVSPLSGSFNVPAISEQGVLFSFPADSTQCTFSSSGTWDTTAPFTTGPTGWGPITSWPGYSAWSWRLISAPMMSLIVRNSLNQYLYAGPLVTLPAEQGPLATFIANDAIGGHYDNAGALTVAYSCAR